MRSFQLFLATIFISFNAFAANPPCISNGKAIDVINQQVLNWKHTTQNQFLARAHVAGKIDAIFSDHSGHNHFSIVIGPQSTDTLEVIYNESFGTLPHLAVGMTVEACGDYITSNAATSSYPPSPDGAIIHWIHRNPSGHGHESGYVAIDGALYGQGNGSGN